MTSRRKTLLTALAAVPILPVAIVYTTLWSSLPRRGGTADLPGLGQTVHVELDAHGVPRLHAASIEDVFRAQGFMHAQERFFQMDLMRRSVAGELAALFGARALAADRGRRAYAFRRRAQALAASLPAEHRDWLAAYAQGVNAGLRDLGASPPEYLLLGATPEPWTIADSLLGVFAIYTMLSNNDNYEKPQAVMEATLDPAVYEFLTPSTARLDRPVRYPPGDRTAGYEALPIPPPSVVDLRKGRGAQFPHRLVDPPLAGPASNQWASDARRSARGDAMLGNDPHLELRVPNLFYRAELYWPGHAARGVSIPGLPGILIGASESLAWGATVSNVDQSDWIVVDVDPRDPSRYRTPDGFEPFGAERHEIAVAGEQQPALAEVRTTRWGPVVDQDGLGRPLVLQATWLADGGVTLDILELMLADSVERGLDVVGRWAGPSLNWMLADSGGRIGWAVNGPVPRRVGFDGSAPRSRADGALRWEGTVTPPRAAGADAGVLFTANSRTVPSAEARSLSRMWMRPLRAQRIDQLLAAKARLTESDFLDMQLDTRALGYEPIRDLVLEVVAAGEHERFAWARRTAAEWNGRADADEPGFRLMHAYYRALLERVLGPLLEPAFTADPEFVYRWPLADEPLARLLEERPAHLLPGKFADWPAFLKSVLGDVLAELDADGAGGLETRWGEVNRLDVAHPFSAVPLIGRWLRLPDAEQSGSMVSLRVAAPRYGAVIRVGVSPANPAAGFLQMPGGQSGHFLSPNFADLHADWASGTPTPFLAGPTRSQFTLAPAREPADDRS